MFAKGLDSTRTLWYNTPMLNNNNQLKHGPISQQTNGSRSVFARIMSTENITVSFDPKSKDAWFDTRTRTLMMPNWTGMTPEVYDLLLSHEVSHALHTPCDGWISTTDELAGANASDADKQVARQYLNIIEDSRIERLIKAKYPGLARDYMKGYEWMTKNKVFGNLDVADFGSLNFIDRINLHFKIGNHAGYTIPFSPEEQALVDMVSDADTFEDVQKVTRLVWDHAKGEASKSSSKQPGGRGGTGDGEGQEGEGEEESGNEKGDLRKMASKTAKAQENFLNKSQPKKDRYSSPKDDKPCILPDYDLNKVIVPNKTITDQIGEAMSDCTKCSDWITESRGEYAGFLSEAKPTVDAMVKTFLLKKAATAHHRSQNAKSGTLDMNLLSTYKWNEDLFKHFTIKPNGKNHGFVVLLDWSGSMGGLILNVVKQMYILTDFFRKIGVPYEVYAFSSHKPTSRYITDWKEYNDDIGSEDEQAFILNESDERVATSRPFYLYQFASSTLNGAAHKDAMEKLWHLAYNMNPTSGMYNHNAPEFPQWLSLGDTPLDHSLIAANKIVQQFQQKNRVEIMNVVVVTDGSTSSSPVHGDYYTGRHSFTRVLNPKTGASFPLESQCSTNVLAEYLKDNTGCNTMMLFLSVGTTANDVIPGYKLCTPDRKAVRDTPTYFNDDPAKDALQKHWNDENYLMAIPDTYNRYMGETIPALGFDSVFSIRISRKQAEDAYEGLDMSNTTYARLKSQFVKSLSRKIVSRSLVNRMVEAVAKHT